MITWRTLFFLYDPPKRDQNYKTFYALVKNDHIYTINTDLAEGVDGCEPRALRKR